MTTKNFHFFFFVISSLRSAGVKTVQSATIRTSFLMLPHNLDTLGSGGIGDIADKGTVEAIKSFHLSINIVPPEPTPLGIG